MQFVGSRDLTRHSFFLFFATVIQPRVVKPCRQSSDLCIKRGRHCNRAARLVYLKELAMAEARDLCPGPGGRRNFTTLNRVDHDAFLQRGCHDLRILHLVLIVHVRRCITDQEHDLVGL